MLPGLEKEEQDAVEKRRSQVLKALEKLSTKANEAPVIAVLGSGGGLRAHFACIGVLSELKSLGLLDTVTYLSGVSGSTWALSSFYTKNGDTDVMEAELKLQFDQEWDLTYSIKKLIEAAKSENYSLTDFWAYLVVSRQTREVLNGKCFPQPQSILMFAPKIFDRLTLGSNPKVPKGITWSAQLHDSSLSSMVKYVEEGTLPYPIFAAIDNDLHQRETKALDTWFEFTPHHAGYPKFGAYIPVTYFGSKFQEGSLVKAEPERDLSFLKGLWGSALGSLEEIKYFILEELLSLKEKEKKRHLGPRGERYQESPGVASINRTGINEKDLLDLVTTYVEDSNAPSILNKLQDLQKELEPAGGEEAGEIKHRLLGEMVENWNTTDTEEKGNYLERLIQSFVEPKEDSDLTGAYFRLPLTDMIFDVFGICNVLLKTGKCCSKWEWGTIHNFLYKHGDIMEEMSERKLLHLVDAGFAINTAYPLVLLPDRKVQLILSFDFSAGDPFETIRTTAKYCQDQDLPFPLVEEAKLQEWSENDLVSCYILKEENSPVVMHFPLFNKDNCGDDFKKEIDRYSTFKISDSYTEEMVTHLLELSKKNVHINKEKILSEIKNIVSSP